MRKNSSASGFSSSFKLYRNGVKCFWCFFSGKTHTRDGGNGEQITHCWKNKGFLVQDACCLTENMKWKKKYYYNFFFLKMLRHFWIWLLNFCQGHFKVIKVYFSKQNYAKFYKKKCPLIINYYYSPNLLFGSVEISRLWLVASKN